MKTGIIVDDVEDWADEITDDAGDTIGFRNYRATRVLLTNGHLTTAFIHNEPGEYSRYKKGDTVRVSWNDQDGDASGCNIEGLFGDDFTPTDTRNKETHGPSDGDLVYVSRQDLRLRAAENVSINGDVVQLGVGSSSGDEESQGQSAIGIHSELRTDADRVWAILDPRPAAPFGLILAELAVGVPTLLSLIDDFTAVWELAEPESKGAANVNAAPESD